MKVMKFLMGNGTYDKRVRPVALAEETLEVMMEVQLKSMFDVSVWWFMQPSPFFFWC